MPEFEVGRPKWDLGLMRHQVTLQEKVTSRGPTGMEVITWQAAGTYRARVENLTGRELTNAAQLKNTIKHKITLRVFGPLAVDSRFLFEGTGRVFNVEVVYRIDERNAFYELWCSELAAH